MLWGGLEMTGDPYVDRHDGGGGIDLSPIDRIAEQQLDRLDEVVLGVLDRGALAHHVQLQASRDVPRAFLMNRSGQAHVDTIAALAAGGRGSPNRCSGLGEA